MHAYRVVLRAEIMKLWGLNCDSDLALVQGFPHAFNLSAFKPDILRFPGGTWSNFYDWRSGWARPGYLEFADAPYSKGKSFKLEDFARMFPPPMRVLWTLNIVTDSLISQLDMLHHAVSLGYVIEFIELGNEVNPGNGGPSGRAWPTSKAYMAEMNVWIAALKREFPKAKVAVQGSWEDGWNARLSGKFDAVTLHVYSENHGNDGDIEFAVRDFNMRMKEYISTIPSKKPVWVTEYGSSSWVNGAWGQQQGTHAQAEIQKRLRIEMQNNKRVEIAILHTMCGIHADSYGLYNGFYGNPPDALTQFGAMMAQ